MTKVPHPEDYDLEAHEWEVYRGWLFRLISDERDHGWRGFFIAPDGKPQGSFLTQIAKSRGEYIVAKHLRGAIKEAKRRIDKAADALARKGSIKYP